MVKDRSFDPTNETGEMEILVLHCLQCGEIIDPIIMENRVKPVLI